MMESITGTVESNDGNTAAVRFSDGAVKLFLAAPNQKRNSARFFLSVTVKRARLEIKLSDREGLFDGIKAVFPHKVNTPPVCSKLLRTTV